MHFLNNKEIKKFVEMLENQFKTKIKLDYYVCSKENKFYIINKEVSKINLDELNIRSIGLYFGKLDNNKFIISDEAAHLLDLHVAI